MSAIRAAHALQDLAFAARRAAWMFEKLVHFEGDWPTYPVFRRLSWLHRLIYDLAWPNYACELCVGQEGWQGCYCQYHRAPCPAGPAAAPRPMWTYELFRWLWDRVNKDSDCGEDWHASDHANSRRLIADRLNFEDKDDHDHR